MHFRRFLTEINTPSLPSQENALESRRLFSRFIGDIQALTSIHQVAKEERIYLIFLGMLVLLGAFLRLMFISQPMRYDEAFTYTVFASRGLREVLTNYQLPNNHIFHSILVALTTNLLGNQPWIIRLPTFLAGMLTIPSTYFVARSYFNQEAGVLSAGLVAGSSLLIEYSTNARGYQLICLFTLLLLLLARRILSEPKPLTWGLFIGISALGLFTVPTMLYPYGGVVVWLLVSVILGDVSPEIRKKFLVALLLSVAAVFFLVFMLYLPAIIYSGLDRLVNNQFVQPGSWAESLRLLGSLLISLWDHWNRDIPQPLAWLLLIGCVLALLFHRRLSKDKVSLLGVMLLWCLVFALLSNRVPPWSRVFLFLLPLYFIWASAGLVYLLGKLPLNSPRLVSKIIPTAALFIAFLIGYNLSQSRSVYYSEQTGALQDAEYIAVWLDNHAHQGDAIASYVPSDAPLQYYLDKNHITIPHIYRRGQDFSFRRAFVIVSRNNGQSLEYVLDKVELKNKLDLSTSRLVKSFPSADIFEVYRAGVSSVVSPASLDEANPDD